MDDQFMGAGGLFREALEPWMAEAQRTGMYSQRFPEQAPRPHELIIHRPRARVQQCLHPLECAIHGHQPQ